MFSRYVWVLVALARAIGGIRHWIRDHGARFLIVAGAAVAGVWLGDALLKIEWLGFPQPSWTTVWNVTLGGALLALLLSALRARRSLVVGEFTREDAEAQAVKIQGLGALLVGELSRVAELHSIQGARGLGRSVSLESGMAGSGTIPASIKVDVENDHLTNAVSGESSISLGPLKVPVGALFALISRLSRGRHLVGSLHVDSAGATLTAQLVGRGGESETWQVRRSSHAQVTVAHHGASGEDARSMPPQAWPLGDMIGELAVRIHTDLVLAKATNWQAGWRFAAGLEAFAQSLEASEDRPALLRRAEERFIETSAHDPRFDLAYYNLGIVYRYLGRTEAADNAFLKAVHVAPERLDAYYALAESHHEVGESHHVRGEFPQAERAFGTVIWLCDRVLAGHPHRWLKIQAENLTGLVERRLSGDHALRDAARSRKRAVAGARRGLMAAYVGDRPRIAQYKSVLAICLENLGTVWALQADREERWPLRRWRLRKRAESLLRQATRLSPHAAEHAFEYAKVRWKRRQDDKAVRAFSKAAEISVIDPDLWSRLAEVLVARGRKEEAREACRQVLRLIHPDVPDLKAICERVAGTFGKLGDESEQHRVTQLPAFSAYLAEKAKAPDAERQLREWRDDEGLAWGERPWEAANVDSELANAIMRRDPRDSEAISRFESAIQRLGRDYLEEIRRRGLRVQIAWLKLQAEKPDAALTWGESAVNLDPLNHYENSMLAQIQSKLNDLPAAEATWRRALLARPEDPAAHALLGICIHQRAGRCRNRENATAMLRDAAKELGHALDLLETNDLPNRARAREWLGRLHSTLGEHDAAITDFEVMHALQPKRIEPRVLLGGAYLANAHYDIAERWFREVIEESRLENASDQQLREPPTTEEDTSRGELLARGYLGLAATKVARGAGLDGALRLVAGARRCIYRSHLPADTRAELLAQGALCEGSVHLEEGRAQEAVDALDRSLSLQGSSKGYIRLASALLAQGEEMGGDGRAAALVRRAKGAASRAEAGDTLGHLTDEIRRVRKDITAAEGPGQREHVLDALAVRADPDGVPHGESRSRAAEAARERLASPDATRR